MEEKLTAGSTGRYHLYQRTIKLLKRPVKAWYYWYEDGEGKKIRRSCGVSKVPCTLRRDAEAFIARLEERDAQESQQRETARAVRLRDVAAGMFTEGGKHMELRKQRGELLSDLTMTNCRGVLKTWILPRWGDYQPQDIKAAEVEDWLLEVKRANSTKNWILEIFNEVLSECLRYEIIKAVPVIHRFKRNSARQSVLTKAEIDELFPDSPDGLQKVWGIPDSRDPPWCGLMFGALYFLMLGTGARSGEARALRLSQIDKASGGLILNQSMDGMNRVVSHLKKGNSDDPRLRVTIMPKRVQRALDWWIEKKPSDTGRSELVFLYRGRSISKDFLCSRFTDTLARAKIGGQDRRLTPHSLRYTYTTHMRRCIPGEPLRAMTGHLKEDMTDHYTRAELEGQLKALQAYRPALDQFWG